jgi:hypothetical protein
VASSAKPAISCRALRCRRRRAGLTWRVTSSGQACVSGERDDPYAALSKLATRLEATLSPEQVLPAIIDSVATALRSPYAAIEVGDGDGTPNIAAARGALPAGAVPIRVPLTSSGTHVGDLVVAPAGGRPSTKPTGGCWTAWPTTPAPPCTRPA